MTDLMNDKKWAPAGDGYRRSFALGQPPMNRAPARRCPMPRTERWSREDDRTRSHEIDGDKHSSRTETPCWRSGHEEVLLSNRWRPASRAYGEHDNLPLSMFVDYGANRPDLTSCVTGAAPSKKSDREALVETAASHPRPMDASPPARRRFGTRTASARRHQRPVRQRVSESNWCL